MRMILSAELFISSSSFSGKHATLHISCVDLQVKQLAVHLHFPEGGQSVKSCENNQGGVARPCLRAPPADPDAKWRIWGIWNPSAESTPRVNI
jgi:hypothetical protein